MELTGLTERFEKLSIEKLVKANWNYKEEDELLQEKLVNNIKRNGQLENIIVRELDTGAFEIVNGNHRYDAFKDCGFKEVVVCNLGKISLNEAKQVALETNETKFKNNDVKLYEILKDISADKTIEELSKTLPYSPELIEDKINLLDFDFNSYESNHNDFKSEIDNALKENLTFKVDREVALQMREILNNIKNNLFPENDSHEIEDQLAIQAIIQFLIENDYNLKIR